MGELATHAVTYADLGLLIFPCKPDKSPHTSQHDASSDLDQIEEWWKRWPEALIGCRLDPHTIILDIDPRHGGLKTWKALRQLDQLDTRAHLSGRGDGGGHVWLQRPADKLTITKLDGWAKERGCGHEQENGRWSCGIDLLRHEHRYTILPPSPHPATGKPYEWMPGHGINAEPAPCPLMLAELLTNDTPPTPSEPPRPPDPNSIADWYSGQATWPQLLEPHGWQVVAGDGDQDGSRWRRPGSDNAHSATVRHHQLFVYSPNTPFEVTAPDEPNGYTPFKAYAVLEHAGSQSAAAKAARELKGDPGPPQGQPEANGSTPRVVLTPASSIIMDRPRWVWERRIPVGGTTLVAGREGMGKTALVGWLCARLTCGELDGEWHGTPADVVYIGYEDDRSTVLVPRLTAAGADLDRFHFVDTEVGFTIGEHVDDLATSLRGRPIALVVLDPLDSHLGGSVDSHKKAEVQATVARLAKLAQELRCGALGIAHLNKAPIADLLSKVVGSVGFTTSVRSVLGVGEHPDDETERVCVLAKANMTDRMSVSALKFRVEGATVPHPTDPLGIDTGKVAILGEQTGIDPNVLLVGDSEERGKLDEAVAWLDDHMAEHGPEVPAQQIKSAAKAAGIAPRTLDRAATKRGIRKGKSGYGKAGWFWCSPSSPSSRQSSNLGENGKFGENAGTSFSPHHHSRQHVDTGENDGENVTREDLSHWSEPGEKACRRCGSTTVRDISGICDRCLGRDRPALSGDDLL